MVALRTLESEYLPWVLNAGFRIYLHDQSESVFLESTSYAITSGYNAQVLVEKVSPSDYTDILKPGLLLGFSFDSTEIQQETSKVKLFDLKMIIM